MIDEKRILRGLREATAAGWRVALNMADVDYADKCGCALSVAAVGEGQQPLDYVDAARRLGLSPAERQNFIWSFDRGVCHPDGSFVQFAADLRKNCFTGRTRTEVIT